MLKTDTNTQSIDDILTEIGFGRFQICTIFILGFVMIFDSSAMVMLAFIGPILSCDWRITMGDLTVLSTAVFIAMFAGSCLFGKLSDMYGRKYMLLVAVGGLLYFSMLSAVCPTMAWLTVFRGIVGVFIGGSMGSIAAYCSEVLPVNYRGMGMLSLEVFFTLGSLFQSILVMFLVPKYGWRLWLLFTALPIIFVLPCLIWLTESPRQLLTKNRIEEACESLERIAALNKKKINRQIEMLEPIKANLLDVIHHNYLLTTLLMLYLWFLLGFSYFGFLQTSVISDIPHKCLQKPSKTSSMVENINSSIDTSCCYRQTWSDFKILLIANAGETGMCILTMIFCSYFKRKYYMFFLVFLNMIASFLMNLCLSSFNMGLLMLLGRGSSSCLFGMAYLYTSEVYPTTIRSYAVGFGSAFARFGAIVSQISFVFLMIKVSFLGGSLVFCALNFVGLICIVLLPYETKNMVLRQGIEDEIECNNPIYNKRLFSYGTNKDN